MIEVATKKRIVMATYGSPGDLQPFLAIGCELRARGYDVVVATCATYRDRVVAADLEFAVVRPDRLPGQQDPDFLDRLFREHRRPAAIFGDMFLPCFRESVCDTFTVARGADAIISHPLATSARLVAEALRLPWISTVMQPMGYLSAHQPPIFGPPWIAALFRRLGPRPSRAALEVARYLTDRWADEWRTVRAELGLPPVTTHPLWEGQHSPSCSLGLFPRVLGWPQPDWPAQARVTGFPFYNPPCQHLDPELEDFMDSGDPPIVFTLGTTAVNDPGSFYEESVAAMRRLGRRAVLLVGRRNGNGIHYLSSDVMAVAYAPHEPLFARAAAIVHQGGIGTLSEAMRAGKPALIMPYGHDQADNAWRASQLGVARVISRRNYRAKTVHAAIDHILRDPGHVQSACSIAKEIDRDRGAVVAADLVEETLQTPDAAHSSLPQLSYV